MMMFTQPRRNSASRLRQHHACVMVRQRESAIATCTKDVTQCDAPRSTRTGVYTRDNVAVQSRKKTSRHARSLLFFNRRAMFLRNDDALRPLHLHHGA